MRFALAVEYNGHPFCGWQRQKHSASVQQSIEEAIGRIADHDVTVHCAGRTDTGVHALAQIVHFDTSVSRPLRAWCFGVNTHLPRSVAVHWVSSVPDHFHARYKAQSRSYCYTIINRPNRPGFQSEYMHWVSKALDTTRMHEAAQALLGKHDFSAFRSADCQAPHAIRTLTHLSVTRSHDKVHITITGNAFLHNMVRIIVGSLLKIGLREKPPHWLQSLLDGRDRTRAGMTAPAAGLCFLQPRYPSEFGVPDFVGLASATTSNS